MPSLGGRRSRPRPSVRPRAALPSKGQVAATTAMIDFTRMTDGTEDVARRGASATLRCNLRRWESNFLRMVAAAAASRIAGIPSYFGLRLPQQWPDGRTDDRWTMTEAAAMAASPSHLASQPSRVMSAPSPSFFGLALRGREGARGFVSASSARSATVFLDGTD